VTRVLDASALMAYLEKESGYEKVKDVFTKAAESENPILMSVVNWGEVYYILIKEHGNERAQEVISLIETFPLDIVSADKEITKQAALYKAQKKLAYADSYAAALAKLRKGELITADKEFKAVENEIKIVWVF